MRFRQRLAWLVIVFFLAATCALVYYIFEINEHFNKFAIDHVEKFHTNSETEDTHGLWHHIIDIPAFVFFIIFIMAYLQIFFMILACTRTEPKHSFAYIWPIFLSTKVKSLVSNCSLRIEGSKKSHDSTNGYITIDTWIMLINKTVIFYNYKL